MPLPKHSDACGKAAGSSPSWGSHSGCRADRRRLRAATRRASRSDCVWSEYRPSRRVAAIELAGGTAGAHHERTVKRAWRRWCLSPQARLVAPNSVRSPNLRPERVGGAPEATSSSGAARTTVPSGRRVRRRAGRQSRQLPARPSPTRRIPDGKDWQQRTLLGHRVLDLLDRQRRLAGEVLQAVVLSTTTASSQRT